MRPLLTIAGMVAGVLLLTGIVRCAHGPHPSTLDVIHVTRERYDAPPRMREVKPEKEEELTWL